MDEHILTLDKGTTSTAWNHGGQRLAAGLNDGTLFIYDSTDAASSVFNCTSRCKFVAARMMPSRHVSDVPKSKAALVYCILTGRTVDAGRVIMYLMIKAAWGTSTVSMPHSATITKLCHAAGITWDEGEQVLPPKGVIPLVEALPRDKRRRDTSSGGEDSGSGAQPHLQPAVQAPPVHTDMMQSVHERLDDLERMMRMQWQITREQFDYVHDFNVVLARRFPPSSVTDEPFPPPSDWSHQPVEDDYEYDDDEDDELQDVDSES